MLTPHGSISPDREPTMWPSGERLLAAWTRLVADRDTGGSFAELVLPPLVADLSREFAAHPSEIQTAAHTAVLTFLRHPERFDPGRSLPVYLRTIARGDMRNLLDADRRRRRNEIPWQTVELDVAGRNSEEDEPVRLADAPAVRAAIDALPEADRRVYDLMADGERATGVFALALGIADRPREVQADEVKRAKDRVKARLKRAGGGT